MTEQEATATIDELIKLLEEQLALYRKMRVGILQQIAKRNKQ
jgi:hypothetical protein